MQHGHQVLVKLRELIASGEFKPGERITEIPTAERLGVSRLPVRLALRILEQEGLVEKMPRRGFAVRKITTKDFLGALDVRGVLEGLAARQAAEKGMAEDVLQQLQQSWEALDQVFAREPFSIEDVELYHSFNVQFHQAILEASDNPAIKLALAKVESLPFASVQSLVIDSKHLHHEKKRLYYAHMQHHAILQALQNRQAARAENLMKEHANSPILFTDLLQRFSEHDPSLHIIQENIAVE